MRSLVKARNFRRLGSSFANSGRFWRLCASAPSAASVGAGASSPDAAAGAASAASAPDSASTTRPLRISSTRSKDSPVWGVPAIHTCVAFGSSARTAPAMRAWASVSSAFMASTLMKMSGFFTMLRTRLSFWRCCSDSRPPLIPTGKSKATRTTVRRRSSSSHTSRTSASTRSVASARPWTMRPNSMLSRMLRPGL